MAILHFQRPECGFGHREVGHLMDEGEIYCVVCVEEQRRYIRVHCWEVPIRLACAHPWQPPEMALRALRRLRSCRP